MDGERKLFVEHLGELAGILGGGAIGAAEAEREADDDFADFVTFENLFQEGEVGALVFAEERGKALGGDAEGVRDGEADTAGAVVDGEDASVGYRRRLF